MKQGILQANNPIVWREPGVDPKAIPAHCGVKPTIRQTRVYCAKCKKHLARVVKGLAYRPPVCVQV